MYFSSPKSLPLAADGSKLRDPPAKHWVPPLCILRSSLQREGRTVRTKGFRTLQKLFHRLNQQSSQGLTETKVSIMRLHGSALGSLCMYYGCVVWCSCRLLTVSVWSASDSSAYSWDPYPPTGLPHLGLICEYVLNLLHIVMSCQVDFFEMSALF